MFFARLRVSVRTCVRACMHACMRACVRGCVCVCLCVCVCVCVCLCMCMCEGKSMCVGVGMGLQIVKNFLSVRIEGKLVVQRLGVRTVPMASNL